MTRNKCFSNIAPKGGTTASEGVALEPTKKKGNNNFINVLHEMIEVESNDVIGEFEGRVLIPSNIKNVMSRLTEVL